MRPNFKGKELDAVQQFWSFFRTNHSSSYTFTKLINNLGGSQSKILVSKLINNLGSSQRYLP